MIALTRRDFIKVAGAAALTARSANAVGTKPDRPNILVIFSDQLSMDVLNSPGRRSFLKTPNLDALAAGSMSFQRAYASNPLCIPSRSSIFTGRYPVETGIETNVEQPRLNPQAFPCMGTIFKQAGYHTAYFGKWHIPYATTDAASHGFEEVEAKVVDTETADQVVKFLNRPHDESFLAIASFLNPHNICEWARGDALNQGDIGEPPPPEQCPPLRLNHGEQQDEPDIMSLMRRSYQAAPMFPVGNWSDGKWRQYEWAYCRLIERMDAQVGRVIQGLKDTGTEKNTVVVFLADHGDCQGAHGWNQKTVFYEESVRVPLLISYPGRVKPGTTEQLVNTGIDLLPTLCDFAGITASQGLHGLSMRPVVTRRAGRLPRQYVVASNELAQGAPIDGVLHHPKGRMLRSERYKYCVYSEGKRRESLVDLVEDPGEMKNLAGEVKLNGVLKEHREMLRAWSTDVGDRFPYQTGSEAASS